MGCCGSSTAVPDEILDDPTGDVCNFKVKKAGMMSSHYAVLNAEDKPWLLIRNDSGWFAKDATFQLENYVREEGSDRGKTLVQVTVEGTDSDINKDVDWAGDSDNSDNESIDDLFDFGDDDDVKVKLKWKVKRTATFTDADGNEFAKLKIKVKGKSKAEGEIKQAEEGGPTTMDISSKTKLKKVIYALTFNALGEDPVEVTFENGHWQDWDREWACPMFTAKYDAKFGTDQVSIDSTGQCLGANALAVGFAMSYFFHPASFLSELDGQARSEARQYLRQMDQN